MDKMPKCPNCNDEYTYNDGTQFVCPMCGYEWMEEVIEEIVVNDANGNKLSNGDNVMIIKDLKVKGASNSIKVGTKVKNIRVLDSMEDGHDITGKVDGFGALNLKSEYVKKY